jgi:G protein-coupled receptor kinase
LFVVDVRYEYVVDQQPIGRLLFEQWCEVKRRQYYRCVKFLDVAKRYEVETDEQRLELANAIKKEFMVGAEGEENISLPEVGLVLSMSDKLTNGHKDLFAPCVQAVKACLAGEPFREFVSSMYFHRYLQWKWLESQPVTYKTFRMYRVLGKGGFGEVCACQVS